MERPTIKDILDQLKIIQVFFFTLNFKKKNLQEEFENNKMEWNLILEEERKKNFSLFSSKNNISSSDTGKK